MGWFQSDRAMARLHGEKRSPRLMKQSTKISFIAVTRCFHPVLPCRAAVVPQDPHLCGGDHPPAPQGDRVVLADAEPRTAGTAGHGLLAQGRDVRRSRGSSCGCPAPCPARCTTRADGSDGHLRPSSFLRLPSPAPVLPSRRTRRSRLVKPEVEGVPPAGQRGACAPDYSSMLVRRHAGTRSHLPMTAGQ